MEYEPGNPGYIEPTRLVASIQQQHEKPLERAAACRAILSRIETDAQDAFQTFLDVIAHDRHRTVEQVIDEGRDLFHEAKREKLLQLIERGRQPIWYHASFAGGRSGYFTYVPDDYVEGTLTGPAPQPESIIQHELETLDGRVEQESIHELDIINAWRQSYSTAHHQEMPGDLNSHAFTAETIFKYLNRMRYECKPIIELAEALAGGDSGHPSVDPSTEPQYASMPIPWAWDEASLKDLFKYLAKNEYVFDDCVQRFDEIVVPHFLIQGDRKPFKNLPVKILWRKTNVSLIALFAAMPDVGCMSPDENASYATYMKENFLDNKGNYFKYKSLRVAKSNSDAGSASYQKQVKSYKILLESINKNL